MNLRAMANALTRGINPNQPIKWAKSTGYTTAPDGARVPTLQELTIEAQVQPVAGDLLKQMDGLNFQGVLRSLFIYEDIQGLVRTAGKGGDLVYFKLNKSDQTASAWKVVHVVESWPEWSHVIVALNYDS